MKKWVRNIFGRGKGRETDKEVVQADLPLDERSFKDKGTVLLNLGPNDPYTFGHALRGTHVFGGTGAGKSSSVGFALGTSFLRFGMGGLILTVKTSETLWWKYLATLSGRYQDVIVMRPRGKWKYNFLRAASKWAEYGGSLAIVDIFVKIAQAQKSANGMSANDEFFINMFEKMVKSAIDVILIGKLDLTLRQIADIIRTAPLSQAAVDKQFQLQQDIGEYERQLAELKAGLEGQTDEKIVAATQISINKIRASLKEAESKKSVCYTAVLNADEKSKTSDNPAHRNDAQMAFHYFMDSFPNEAEKQRSGYIGIWDGMANKLLTGELNQLFNTETTFDLEQAFTEGKLIIVDLPTMMMGETGVVAQLLMKYMFQQTIRRRQDLRSKNPRPAFLWADEAQLVFAKYDGEFQALAREFLCCTVFLSQTYSNYMNRLGGGDGSRAAIDVLMANLRNRFFGENSNYETNTWAKNEIGMKRLLLFNESSGMSWDPLNGKVLPAFNNSSGQSETFAHVVQDTIFSTLRNVTKPPHQPEFIYHISGDPLSNGQNYMKVMFQGHVVPEDFEEPADIDPPSDGGHSNQPPGPPPNGLRMEIPKNHETVSNSRVSAAETFVNKGAR